MRMFGIWCCVIVWEVYTYSLNTCISKLCPAMGEENKSVPGYYFSYYQTCASTILCLIVLQWYERKTDMQHCFNCSLYLMTHCIYTFNDLDVRRRSLTLKEHYVFLENGTACVLFRSWINANQFQSDAALSSTLCSN